MQSPRKTRPPLRAKDVKSLVSTPIRAERLSIQRSISQVNRFNKRLGLTSLEKRKEGASLEEILCLILLNQRVSLFNERFRLIARIALTIAIAMAVRTIL